jgi:hypothetical protein
LEIQHIINRITTHINRFYSLSSGFLLIFFDEVNIFFNKSDGETMILQFLLSSIFVVEWFCVLANEVINLFRVDIMSLTAEEDSL